MELLRYAVPEAGYIFSQVMLAGDAAGCILILGMVGHIWHPHPRIEALELSESLRGAVISSPWTNLYCTGDSYVKNWQQDPVMPWTNMM